MKTKLYIFFLTLSLFATQLTKASVNVSEPATKEDVSKFLTEDLERLYSVTYYKLISRMDSCGYLQESLTGAYKGMYPRTVGAYALLMIETERYSKAEIALKYILDAMKDNEEIFVPHVVGNEGNDNGGRANIIDDQYQSDAHAHIILGWARLASARGITQFERDTWPQVKALMNRIADRTLFQYGSWSIEPGLLRAVTFEHSRDGRMWDAYDLLTQSFFGAALSEMAKIADTMSETALASTWREKERILSEGINKNLVVERDGQQTYAEMFIPNGNGGTPYMEMGWVCFSPVAAGWEGVDHSVLRNTMGYMEKNYLQTTDGIRWMPTDVYSDGVFVDEVIGKGIGWELDYARSEENYERIYEILQLIKAANTGKPIYMEFAWLEGNGFTRNSKITKSAVDSKMQGTTQWTSRDVGNGEQNTWFCWAMARLRKSIGLSAEPAPIERPNLIRVSNNNGWGKRIVNIHSSSGWNNDTENAYNLFLGEDNVLSRSDKWFSTGTSTPWIIFSLADIYKIEKFDFRDGRWFEKEDGVTNVSEYAVYVSTTGTEDSNWTEIIHETGVGELDIKSKVLETPVDARYIKFVAKGGGDTGKKIWIYGIDIYGTLSKKIDRGQLISVGAKIISDGSHASVRETPANLVDGLTGSLGSPWATFKSDQGTPAWTMIDLGKEYDINKFAIVDGADWTTGYNVYVSDDNLPLNSSEWILAASKTFTKTLVRKEITLSSPMKARYVKLEIPTDKEFGWTRIQEFEVYGTEFLPNTGTQETKIEDLLTIRPNPVNKQDDVYVNLDGRLKVFSLQGTKILEREVTANQKVSTKKMISGNYIFQLIDKNGISQCVNVLVK